MKRAQENNKNPYDITNVCIRCGSGKDINNCFECKNLKEHKKRKEEKLRAMSLR